jgi:CBS domain containing-hemolysin-like protein
MRWCRWLLGSVTMSLASLAHASFLPPAMLDAAADWIAVIVLFIVPPTLIGVFWLVHVLPQKAAEDRHHPQKEAIHVLCLLSLVFGGLLWPFAWLWAYTRPVLHTMASGLEHHEDYYDEHTTLAERGELARDRVKLLHDELDRLESRGQLTPRLRMLRDRLVRAEAKAPESAPAELAKGQA